MKPDDLESLLHIDRSDPSTGIKISLKRLGIGEMGKRGNGELELDLSVSPSPPFSYSPDGVAIVNGRVVRESRHVESSHNDWAPVTGPAETEIEKKKAGGSRTKEKPVALDQLEYVVVDVETTGGAHIRGHRMTEIAIVRLDANGKKKHEYSTLINPERLIPYEITKLTRIDQHMVLGAPRFEDVARDVRELLDGRVFVAHNAAFDWGFVNAELIRCTGKPLLGKRLCTVRLARKIVPEIRRRSLDALSYFFNVHNEARHRAYGDARATAHVFRRLLERVWDREIDTWQALDRFVRAPKPKPKRSALPQPIEDV